MFALVSYLVLFGCLARCQTPSFTCVPIGTCTQTNPGGGGGTIDPRISPFNIGFDTYYPRFGYIVSPPLQTSPPPPTQPPQGVCPPGQVACYGPAPAPTQCGQRFVTSVTDVDGPATLGAFPWQAYIRNQNSFAGSGVLIDASTVLTAAHKVYPYVTNPSSIIVNMGVYDPATSLSTSQQRTVASILIHESFDSTTLKNDIAVLRLSSPITLGPQANVGTACLPAAGTSYVGSRCVVSGWGKSSYTSNDAPSPQKQVRVPIVDYNMCRNSMAQASVLGNLANTDRFLDPNGELCAGGEPNRDTCTSDGGSPLVCQDGQGRWNVAGLVIWGKNCGQPGVYGVYADVAKYRSWIDGAISRLNVG